MEDFYEDWAFGIPDMVLDEETEMWEQWFGWWKQLQEEARPLPAESWLLPETDAVIEPVQRWKAVESTPEMPLNLTEEVQSTAFFLPESEKASLPEQWSGAGIKPTAWLAEEQMDAKQQAVWAELRTTEPHFAVWEAVAADEMLKLPEAEASALDFTATELACAPDAMRLNEDTLGYIRREAQPTGVSYAIEPKIELSFENHNQIAAEVDVEQVVQRLCAGVYEAVLQGQERASRTIWG